MCEQNIMFNIELTLQAGAPVAILHCSSKDINFPGKIRGTCSSDTGSS